MNFDQIYNDLKNKIYYPIYFLSGEEPYYIDVLSDYIEENLLDSAEREFNLTILYGRDTNLTEITGIARRFPMMANYQVVIVKEAQDLFNANDLQKLNELIKAREAISQPKLKAWAEQVKARNIQSAREATKVLAVTKKDEIRQIEELFQFIDQLKNESNRKYVELLNLIEQPVKTSIVVFAYKYGVLDKRKMLARRIAATGVLFESTRLYENKVPDWIINYLSRKEYGIKPEACALLADYLGTDLGRISNELGKLIINVPAPATITLDDIEKNIGISKDYNIFELQKAIGARDTRKAFQIIQYFGANARENPAVKTISILQGFFTKLLMFHQLKDKSVNSVASALGIHPFFVNDYLRAARNFPPQKLEHILLYLSEYDMKAKGMGNISADDGELSRELLLRIML